MKELKVQSTLLSSFHHKPYSLSAAVLLPKTYYDQPQRKFPVLFLVVGFGGDYHFRPVIRTVALWIRLKPSLCI